MSKKPKNTYDTSSFMNDYASNESDMYLTRSERKKLRRKGIIVASQPIIPKLKEIKPKTQAQRETFDSYYKDKNLVLHGVAGTGKTFCAMYLALESVLTGDSPKPIVIIRSVVPVRDLGHMPGKLDQKIEMYEAPYEEIISELTDKTYVWMKQHKYIEFTSTSYLRGMTYRDCVIIVDECQNMSEAEIHTIMTRVGEGCRVILCGDFSQKDYMKEASGINTLLKITKKMRSFNVVQFYKEDVVRSGFVKEYILTRLELEEKGML